MTHGRAPVVDILYEDDHCLAVCKPAGVATQAPPGIESIEVRLRSYLANRNGSHDPYLAILHRLDRPVSGVILFATRKKAARKISKQFERRTVKKTYWACVEGKIDPTEGYWRDRIRKVPGIARAEIVDETHMEGRDGILHYLVRGVIERGSWMEVAPITGRTHQIRIQAASRGYPILGDEQYGSSVPFGPEENNFRARAIALHSRALEFEHPVTKKRLLITANPPDFWPQEVRHLC